MSQQPQKQKKKQFMLPSALRNLQHHKQAETQQFIKELGSDEKSHAKKKQGRHSSLFKLNPDSSAIISEVPVQTLRKRSKSQKLQSIQSEQQQAFSLLEHLREQKTKQIKEKHSTLKKYDNIDLRQLTGGEGNRMPEQMEVEELQEQYQIVRPSQTYKIADKEESIYQPTIFQTPILPCFASQFNNSFHGNPNKKIKEGQGLWKIGKIRVKNGKCQMRIGQFIFQGVNVPAEGKAGVVSIDPNRDTASDKLLMLPNWSNMCILQPHEQLFS